jgi:UDP-glucose:(glucosyl)LPS alpha-1,2-glucosyltransferase
MSIAQNELDKNAMGGTELLGLRLEKYLDEEVNHPVLKQNWRDDFQIIRSRVREIERNKKRILWLHDLAEDPEAQQLRNPIFRSQFSKLVFVSHWQQQQYHDKLGVPFAEGVVIKNWIDPIYRIPRDIEANQKSFRFIYHSTPHRGLNILVPVFEELVRVWKPLGVDLHLDVYSSFKLYGWEERDKPFEQLFERIKAHPNMTYYGTRPNEEIRRALTQADFFAYPSTWVETSCLCAIEAMSAGCEVITSTLGALPETVAEFGTLYPYCEDQNQHAQRFFDTVHNVIARRVNGPARRGKDGPGHVLRAHSGGAEQFARLLQELQTK